MRRPQLLLLLLAAGALPARVEAQIPTPITYGDGRRAQATREELQATLAEIEKIVSSPGYSARMRDARRREAELIRERLDTGDLQVGDAIILTVLGEPQFSNTFLIGPGRVLSLPGMPDIPLRGVLRSEAQGYMTEALSKQLRDPQVQVQTNIRLTFTGAVARAGYYQVPADIMPTDAIMTVAGGFAGGADPNRTIIRRQGREIWSREAFQDALLRGMTLDQLNLRTNDEIVVQASGKTSWQAVVGVLGAVSSVTWLFLRVLR
ncbi:MAG: polysaccharide biosynthesis/export family protein [Gemmatimonadales bacterium]|nr:polysaccharide biosynthesis/export family protein [Gemmatimonadales bacterium]